MTNESDTKEYLNAELDKFQAAIDRRDKDGAWRVLEHVRAEAGDQVANIFAKILADRGLASLVSPPVGPPTEQSIELPPKTNKRLIIALFTAVAVLTITVVVLLTVQVAHPSTASTATVSPQGNHEFCGTCHPIHRRAVRYYDGCPAACVTRL